MDGEHREDRAQRTLDLRSRRSVPGVEVHRCRSLDRRDVTTHRGIPVTTVARTCVDLTDIQSALPALEGVERQAAGAVVLILVGGVLFGRVRRDRSRRNLLLVPGGWLTATRKRECLLTQASPWPHRPGGRSGRPGEEPSR